MEKDKNLSAHRTRSFQAIISDGYRLYTQNFGKLVRASWVQAIIYALVTGFSMTYFFSSLLPKLAAHEGLMPELALWGGTFVVFLIAAIIFAFAGGIAPLHEHWQTNAISKPRRWWGRWPWKLTLRGLKVLPRMLWTTIRRGRLWTLIAVALVMLLVVLVATVIFQMPAIILATANIEGATDIAAGDVPDLPENLWALNFFTFSVCGFLQAYIHLSTLFPFYYVWGNTQDTNKHGLDEKKNQ